ncbi:deazaflavin-dependent nitroreductase [Streptomyces sp. CB03234]|uniref:nitroreductase family deazaflavin-dependent oxidoreductase n=1 Tax=Streptomyces sp. (strain CB03234) TaxID=1703937 RepID=UPI00093BF50D|nr:nitroreductase family deazaflavin-dependent oxidoreductase [Streptomyces sp. CB03234]OKJ99580.1 deazaflavin-dependent nitroreductase [Streptomyces sp. CB03234]
MTGPSPALRLVQRVSSTRTFAKLAPYVVPALDRAVHRLTGGKVLLSARMLPALVLVSRGARSGLERRTPLACMPEDPAATTWVLVGSNFGRPDHPAWTGNLLKHPDVEVVWRGRTIPVHARLLKGEDREAAWAKVLRFWPPYAAYQARIDREIRLFRLTRRG